MMRSILCPVCGGTVVALDDTRWALCLCGNRVTCAGAPGETVTVITYEDITRELWRELHEYAVQNRHRWNQEFARIWFSKWLARVPQAGCGCQENFRELIADLPPVFDSANEFFEWSVSAHNRVNVKLGKPLMPLENALLLYVRSDQPAKLGVR